MVQTVTDKRRETQQRHGLTFACRELALVLWDWASGGGDLIGLLKAWAGVVSGRTLIE